LGEHRALTRSWRSTAAKWSAAEVSATSTNAIHTIALIRTKHQLETRAYLDRRISEGKTKREAMRSLKRHISCDLFKRLAAVPLDFIEASLTMGSLDQRDVRVCRAQWQRRGNSCAERSVPSVPESGRFTGKLRRSDGSYARPTRLRALWTKWSVEVRVLSGA
jgi:hypothetical protein